MYVWIHFKYFNNIVNNLTESQDNVSVVTLAFDILQGAQGIKLERHDLLAKTMPVI